MSGPTVLLTSLWRLLDDFRAIFVWSIYLYVLTVPTYFTLKKKKYKHKLARTSVSLRVTSCDVAKFLGQLRGMVACVWPRVREYSPDRHLSFHRWSLHRLHYAIRRIPIRNFLLRMSGKYYLNFQELFDVISILQLKINLELYTFSMDFVRRRIKAANRSASKYRKSARKDLTPLRKEAEEQNLCLKWQLYDAGVTEQR